jgi:hypothetical protein
MRAIVFASFLAFSSIVHAVDFYWQKGDSPQFPSAEALCEYLVTPDLYTTPGTTVGESFVSPYPNSVNVMWCNYKQIKSDGSFYSNRQYTTINRYGDSCPPDTSYNSTNGACEVDCSATVGTTTYQFFLAATRNSVEEPFPDPSTFQVEVPGAICSSSCRYTDSSTGDTVTCGRLTGSDGLGLYCYSPFTGTGEQCQASDEPHTGPGDLGGPTPADPADPEDPTDPAVTCGMTPGYVWTGTTCAPVFEPEPDDGGSDGGDGDGGTDPGTGGGTGGTGGGTGGTDPGTGDGGTDPGTGGGTGGSGGSDGDGGDDSTCTGEECAQDWYQPGERTMETVMQGFTDRVQSSAVVQATDRFFTMNVGGSCPVWSVNAWVFTIVIDQHCSNNIPWAAIRAVLLACAGFVAFRWAFL